MRIRRNEKPEKQNPKTKQGLFHFLKYKKFSLNSPSQHKKKYEFLKAYIKATNLNNINLKHT